MCGIFGIIDPNKTVNHVEILEKANKLLYHRGPDDFGFLSYQNKITTLGKEVSIVQNSEISFLHRRLSIIDLSKNGWQPMSSLDRSCYITFNGEIYNYQEIKVELLTKGYKFQSESDTEIILNAYIEWGYSCINKFIGMFAFAILDLTNQIIFCARDFFGIKPFFYINNENVFGFSSEIKPLLEIPNVSRKANNQLIYEYLIYSQQEGAERCFWKDVNQLPPAHYLIYNLSLKKVKEIKPYWMLNYKTSKKFNFKEASTHLKNLFEKSIKLHLRSDVPIGANLSGGIDSSAIVMMAKKVTDNQIDLSTISFIAEEESINEEKWIDIINDIAKTKPIKVYPKDYQLEKDIEQLIIAQEEPFGTSSPYAQFEVFKAIKNNGIKVVLDGQGADEMLAGYRSYLYVYMESLIRQKKFIKAFYLGFSIMKLPGVNLTFKSLFKLIRSYLAPLTISKKPNEISINSFPEWINGLWFIEKKLIPFQWWRPLSKESMKEQLYYTFINSSLPHLLRVADRNSMKHSIESRLPFLTPQLAEFIFTLDESFIISLSAYTKRIFRSAMKGIVPNEILSRKDKIGFTTPEEVWIKSNSKLVMELINSETAKNIPFLNVQVMNHEWKLFIENKLKFDGRFWRWINIILWTKLFNVIY